MRIRLLLRVPDPCDKHCVCIGPESTQEHVICLAGCEAGEGGGQSGSQQVLGLQGRADKSMPGSSSGATGSFRCKNTRRSGFCLSSTLSARNFSFLSFLISYVKVSSWAHPSATKSMTACAWSLLQGPFQVLATVHPRHTNHVCVS